MRHNGDMLVMAGMVGPRGSLEVGRNTCMSGQARLSLLHVGLKVDLQDREIRKTHWASKLVLFFPMNSRTIN